MEKLKELFAKYGWVLIIIVILLTITSTLRKGILSLLGLGKSEDEKKKEAKQISQVQDKYKIPEDKMLKYRERALSLAKNLGTYYEWYDILNWTENDKAVYYDLRSLKVYDFNPISELYAKNYTVSQDGKERILMADIKHLLSKSYQEKLKTETTWFK